MTTADERVSDLLGRVIDRQVTRLSAERPTANAARILEIDADLAVLATELARVTPRRPTVTVFIGDSITARWDVTTLTTPTVNKGVPGDSPAQIYARRQADVLDLSPQSVHILGGANVIVDDTPSAAPIIDLAKICVAAGIRTYVGTVTPGIDRPQAGVQYFNAQLRSVAATWGYSVIDYYVVMAGNGYFDQSLYVDTVHPNAAGYALMAALFRRTFR